MNNDTNASLLVNASQLTRFERGFKSWAENTSVAIRSRLKLARYSSLSPIALADYLNVRIISPSDVVGLSSETVKYLTSSEGDEWSAVTIHANSKDVIVINPSHSDRRNANTIMHELSHIIRGHKSAQIHVSDTGITFRSYDVLQEAEADWLAGTLLLPREALINCHFRHYTTDEACEIYGVSKALFTYRMNKSAIKKIFHSSSS